MTTRSEERVVTASTTRVTARVRLQRVVVEEERTVTVRLRREEVRVVRDDVDDAADDGDASPEATPRATPWVVLREERVQVTTEVVPVARVRLVVDRVEQQVEQQVELAREVVEVEAPPARP